MDTCKYIRKPLIVDGVQVTEENFVEVAKWCEGELHWTHTGKKVFTNGHITGTIDPSSGADPIEPENQYIEVNIINPKSARQSRAYVGDWVLKSEFGLKIYTDRAFNNSFDTLEYETMGNPDQLTTAVEQKED